MKTYILGLSCFFHDSAAALLCDGEIVAAAQEERFTRIKQDCSFPENAVKFCLQMAGITLAQVSEIFYYENPEKKFNRIMSTATTSGWSGVKSLFLHVPGWLTDKIHVRKKLRKALSFCGTSVPEITYIDHHRSHAASAFFPSPYEKALVICIDGVGEWDTTTVWEGDGNRLTKHWEIRFPHSLGLLYSAFTFYCGFKVDSGEYKLMGLAPYGSPVYVDLIKKHLIQVNPDGSFEMDMSFFDYATGDQMTSNKFHELFGGPPRMAESELTEREFNLAASVQSVLEEVVLLMARNWQTKTGATNLCLAGGVALNCVANGKLAESGIFKNIWVQPASGDSGGSLGAALSGWYEHGNAVRMPEPEDSMKGSYLGSDYTRDELLAFLTERGAVFTELPDEKLCAEVARILANGNVTGWFQGRMEFGPRSLGARSILGDARNRQMQTVMNLKIKNRESFRPFAPAVLEEYAQEWFRAKAQSPYMLFVCPVAEAKRIPTQPDTPRATGLERLNQVRSQIPAVTHVDNSARLQTVNGRYNPLFFRLLSAFHARTGCPVLVNTSFNVRGEPIVESPENAWVCFMRTSMDYLVLGNFVLRKQDQPAWEEQTDWKEHYPLD
ncbi:carbamoyltransferase [Pantoea sp. At-9b]|uniref:carbamoyltransferase family protein n=1 Tax=Pantoea sp. (strain At-9b) TaxID=592316 RepID=UPI0001F25FB4|nr:carbamoyltransferase [Pantoea sp. At-9b]ADU72827.1 Carbamoyltransferase [Pantoea sp. At-9b]